MSKPNLLGFRTSIGFYRNRRVRECRQNLSRAIRRKVDFCELTPTLFQVVMAYAAENQTNGNFEGYSTERWSEIFASNNIQVSPTEAALIVKEFQRTGLLDGDKIRSWDKFNREFAHYETLTKYRVRGAKMMHKKREMEARAALKNGHSDASNPEKIPSKTVSKPAPKTDEQEAIRKELWTLKELLPTATGKQKRALNEQREKLIARVTGVESTPPPSSPAPSAKPARKKTKAEEESEYLKMAQATLADLPDALSAGMVTALVNAGYKLPAEVETKFRKLIADLKSNPVPE